MIRSSDLALGFNALVWGSTFVLIKAALELSSPLLFVAIRFSIACAVMALMFRGKWRITTGGVLAGVCLFGGFAFQTAGLRLTTASKSAFLTGLSVLLVPFLNSIVYRVYPQVSEVIGIVLATVGMGLMTLQGKLGGIAQGDLLTICCAVAFAGHIVILGHYSKTTPFESLSVVQLGTTAVLAMTSFWWMEKPFFHPGRTLWFALLVSSLLSTALAFSIQAWAQQVTTATRAALIYALEPVFAWMFSFAFMGERLPMKAVVGAVLILAGVVVAELKPIGFERHPSN